MRFVDTALRTWLHVNGMTQAVITIAFPYARRGLFIIQL
jgi:hypothetical protein